MIPARSALALAAATLLGRPAPSADLAELKARGTLRVIVAADEAPETFDPKGGARPGFERELVENFARLQGVSVEVVLAKSYTDRIPMLLAGKGDMIVAIFDTPERRAAGGLHRRGHAHLHGRRHPLAEGPGETLGELRRRRSA